MAETKQPESTQAETANDANNSNPDHPQYYRSRGQEIPERLRGTKGDATAKATK